MTPEALKPHSNYILQSSHKTYCPSCQKMVDLLCDDLFAKSKARRLAKPWFYICWHCHKIYEVGKGEVRKEE